MRNMVRTFVFLAVCAFLASQRLHACVGCSVEQTSLQGGGVVPCPDSYNLTATTTYTVTTGQWTIQGVGCSATGDSTFHNINCVQSGAGASLTATETYTENSQDCNYHNFTIVTRLICTSNHDEIESFNSSYFYRCNKEPNGTTCPGNTPLRQQ